MQTLVTEAEYRAITGDASTPASAVSARLEASLDLIEEYLERTLEHGTYTETLEVWYEDGAGYVYPLVTPVTSIPASADYVVDVGERRIGSISLDDPLTLNTFSMGYGSPGAVGAISPYSRNRWDYSTVTYDGGFTNDTLPYTLKVFISVAARRLPALAGAGLTLVGAEEAAVGDVRVKYPTGQAAIDALVPGMSRGLKGYKRRRVRF